MNIKEFIKIFNIIEVENVGENTAFAIINGQVVFANEIRQSDFIVFQNKIAAIDDIDENLINPKNIVVIDAKDKLITPGLIDQHIHGAYDCNFNTASEDEIIYLLKQLPKHGITAIVPTLASDKTAKLKIQIEKISNIINKNLPNCTKIVGIQLEGPFLNPKYKGIHPKEILIEPTVEEFQKLENEHIKIVAYAPELDKDFNFTSYLKSKNIIPSAGHSCANFEETKKAIAKGLRQITHLFNAMPPLHHRTPSLTAEALINDEIYTEIIADSVHIHPQMLELALKTKPKDRIVFISDSLPLAHSEENSAFFAGEQIFKDGNRAINQKGIMAGSLMLLDDIYKILQEQIKISLNDFIKFASYNPAQNLDLNDLGEIAVNKTADFSIRNKITFNCENVFINGNNISIFF
ncbi:MAG: N-acetylglucosamine-6-phosphate deacetylase [Candidatus Gastranaerophilales bacterium]|nr:N-acetylglucosamine-6-phosphate deacetylase [Candidatus Gastranaerophilales bacterium]